MAVERQHAASTTRINAVNLITATKLPRVPLQRFAFLLSKAPGWLAQAFDEVDLERRLKTFNFLHTARWVSLGRFPRVARDQGRERRSPRWVLFVANFGGAWETYRAAFMEAMSENVYDIWGQSIDYPDYPAPGTAGSFVKWLDTRLPPNEHYYAAYPHARTNDVRAAVRVRREVCSVAHELRAQGVTGTELVSSAFDDLARRVSQCLGPIDPAPSSSAPTFADGSIHGSVAVFPVLPGHEEALETSIRALPCGTYSPFRRVPGTHFARLALLDRREIGRHPTTALRLRNSYLLLAADYDASDPRGGGDRFFRSVYRAMPEEVRSVWRHCWDFEQVDDDREFADLASRCRCPVLREFIDYPDQSLRSVLTALGSQRRFVELLQRRARGHPIEAEELVGFLDHPPSGWATGPPALAVPPCSPRTSRRRPWCAPAPGSGP